MKQLLDRKKDIITDHLPRLFEKKAKANKEFLKLLKKVLKDRKISANVKIEIKKIIKTGGQISSNSSTQMNGEQKLETSRMWLENAKTIIDDARKDDKFTESYFNSIDKEMKRCHKEIKEIDKELKQVKDDDTRKSLQKERRDNILY